MDEVTGMLQRMRTLAQQSANGSNLTLIAMRCKRDGSTGCRDRISTATTFAGTKLLDGTFTGSRWGRRQPDH
jgi:flagellin